MAGGPKKAITAEPLEFKGWPRDRARRRERFIKDYLVVPHGVGGGKPVKLRSFQTDIIRGSYAKGIRTALVSMPRANGKTALAAMLGLAEMFVGDMSAEVLVVASDARQAAITFRMAKRMVELNPELEERVQIYQDKLYLPENDASLIPLPADPAALHGWNPSLMIVDELHVVTEDVWQAVTSVTGKRPESLTLAISTPSDSSDSVMWGLVEHGRSGSDPSFFLKEFGAPEGCAVDDHEAWMIANPAMSCKQPFLSIDGMESVRRTIREPVFRQLRLGQWVTGVESWLPFGAWDACTEHREIGRSKVVLAFDGSASGDSTALIGCTLDGHVFVEGLWENPGDPRWRVPRADVDAAVAMAFEKYDVVELAADPWGWRTEIESWAKRHGEKRVLEWNTAAAQRMAPATDRLYQAVVTGNVTHDGDARLSKHLAHCVAKRTPMGDLVSKDKKNSPRKIDAAVGAIIAFERAAIHAGKSRRRVGSFAA